jgi:hypothetical protein
MRECFAASFCRPIDFNFMRDVLQQVSNRLLQYEWLKSLKCKELIEFITCDVLDA